MPTNKVLNLFVILVLFSIIQLNIFLDYFVNYSLQDFVETSSSILPHLLHP